MDGPSLLEAGTQIQSENTIGQRRRSLFVEAFRGQGAGSWAIDQVLALARQERRPALRLTVIENNPAQALYERKGLRVVGKDECFLRMQLDIPGLDRCDTLATSLSR